MMKFFKKVRKVSFSAVAPFFVALVFIGLLEGVIGLFAGFDTTFMVAGVILCFLGLEGFIIASSVMKN